MEEPISPLRCLSENHKMEMFKDDNVETVTSVEQKKVEDSVQQVFSAYQKNHRLAQPTLQREQHYVYLKRGLRYLSDAYECLDASRPWLCYWILHSLELLDETVPASIASDVCKFLAKCQSPMGGFAGGPGQHAHLAPTYAAVNALCIIGTEEAYNVIDRQKLLDFLYSVKQPDGSFIMHVGGEVDVRSAYCAASVASLTNIITPTLFEGTPNWITSCQNWEGGIGGVPGLEAHGGYTFCGLAAMAIFQKEHMLDLKSLLVSLGLHASKIYLCVVDTNIKVHDLNGGINGACGSAFKTENRRHFFTQRVVGVWNKLPGCVVEADSLAFFKKQLNRLFRLSGLVFNC